MEFYNWFGDSRRLLGPWRVLGAIVSACVKIKFYGAFVLNRRVDVQAIEQAPHLTHWLICTQVSAMIIAFGLLPVEAAMRVLAATAVGTIAAGAYGQSVLGGVMGDFLGATICVLELAIYLALSADASRFDASAVLRLAVVVSLPQIYGRLRNNSEKKTC